MSMIPILQQVTLENLPKGSLLNAVEIQPDIASGRPALRVQLTDHITTNGKPNIDYIDMPTFVVLPITMTNGSLSVDILSRLNCKAPPYARAFAGLAYRIADDFSTFESVYVRPMNGLKLNPPPPRDKRAVQYFAYPDWRFERLRESYPDGRYESPANIGPNEWINLRLQFQDRKLEIFVNDQLSLSVSESKAEPRIGNVGLFVDIGTEAYFSNLRMANA